MRQKYKVFLSYHHNEDEDYRNLFDKYFGKQFISKSVSFGDIDKNERQKIIRQTIKEKHLQDTDIIVVLLGRDTWKRKYVNWEITEGVRNARNKPRSGLLGILLPTHPLYQEEKHKMHEKHGFPLIIPRPLYKYVKCNFAKIYRWTRDSKEVLQWVETAYKNKEKM